MWGQRKISTRSVVQEELFTVLFSATWMIFLTDVRMMKKTPMGVEKDEFIGALMTLSGWLISHNIPLWLSLFSFPRMWKECKWQFEEAELFALVEDGPFHTEGLALLKDAGLEVLLKLQSTQVVCVLQNWQGTVCEEQESV